MYRGKKEVQHLALGKATHNSVKSPEQDWTGWQLSVATPEPIIHLGREHHEKMSGKSIKDL